jgi:hypothetical protein
MPEIVTESPVVNLCALPVVIRIGVVAVEVAPLLFPATIAVLGVE